MWFYNSAAVFLIVALLLVLTLNAKDLIAFFREKRRNRIKPTPVADEQTYIPDPYSTIRRMTVEDSYRRLSIAMAEHVRTIVDTDKPETIELAWQYLLDEYRVFCPILHRLLTSPDYKGTPREHVLSVVKEGVYFYFPDGMPSVKEFLQMLRSDEPEQSSPFVPFN